MIQEVSKARTKKEILIEILTFVLTLLVSTFILRVVWNKSLVTHITVLKPIATLLDAFILALSLQVVRGI